MVQFAGSNDDKPMNRKRFSITLDLRDYERLRELARKHKPRLTFQYVCQYAIQSLLERADDPQFRLQFGDPLDHARSKRG